MFKLFWSLLARPPAPPPVVVVEPKIHTDDESAFYLSRSGRQLRFRDEGHRRLCRLIAMTNKFPPKGTIGEYSDGKLSLFDRLTETSHPLAEETKREFMLAIRSLHRARIECPPAAVNWRSP